MTTRRRFVLCTLAAGSALVIGWSALPPRQRLERSTPLPLAEGEHAFNGWVKVTADDRVIVQVPKSEMGQGIHTALAMVLADELDADWARVQVEHPPPDGIHRNAVVAVDGLPFHPDDDGLLKSFAQWMTAKSMREMGLEITGGSSSVKDLWLPMRQAGASARAMLVGAAAAQWGVPAGECTVRDGEVAHPSGRRSRFGPLAAAAANRPLPKDVALKTQAQFTRIGQDVKRLESKAKVEGRAVFGLDVRQPGQRYASVRMGPVLGSRVARHDASAALKRPGVHRVLVVPGFFGGTEGVAVVADNPWRALQALDAVDITWDEQVPAAAVDSAEAIDRMARLLDTATGWTYHERGDVPAALAQAPRTVQAEYRAPWLAHLALEPMNCTVQVAEGRATVWAPTQIPTLARRAVAQAAGVDSDAITLNVTLLGGGFGRRLEVDFIGQAAYIAAQAGDGAPVQTFWRREEDTRHDFYRPACVARYTAALDATGRPTALKVLSAGQAIVPQLLERAFGVPGGGPDKTAAEGAFDQAYEWPSAHYVHEAVELPVPVGFWRSVGHSHQAFFHESFADECAHAAGADPVAWRLSLLQQHPRHAAVLRRAAEAAGWGTPLAPAADGAPRARGVALHQSFGSVVAQVAEVSLGPDRAIRVHRVVCAIDCGTPVNPNHIRQQIEGSIVFGLSAALYGGVTIDKGRVKEGNFHDQPLVRLDACPVIEAHIVPSTEHPEGVGEPATPPVAPAVANALFALTGQRLRSLPLKPA